MYYLCLVLCIDESIYTGVTDNPERRFSEHKTNQESKHTREHRAVELLYVEEFSTMKEAFAREKQIKGWRREKKLNLIRYGKPC